ncbi:pentapeptide repeat-containing protein [Citrobacter sp. R56]|uniref:pentapeptide repeat-containing protein n=1 Tax=Citrobacter sp. R56 TaxID=1573676 RepID=UPI00193B51FA|nr:pentapeptide repeat-containing protein [Citrobacter sp. R56]QRG79202.1 pentapeptide repeat-containing protein [Citrobacter sp. R56]
MTTSQNVQPLNNSVPPPTFVDDHRLTCYWESVYDTSVDLKRFKQVNIRDINTIRNNGDHLKNYVIDLDNTDNKSEAGKPNTKRIVIENAFFEICDFRGNNSGQKITFKNCEFKKVYFGHSELHDVNFDNCTFNESSFSLVKFYRCSFNELCRFKKISISGGKTNFDNSIISSGDLLSNAFKYATSEYCNTHSLNKEDQVYRMYLSQVKLARNILNSVSIIGDDDIYYNATKTLFKLRLKERESKIKLSARNYRVAAKKENKFRNNISWLYKTTRSFLFPFEKIMLNCFGLINGWGSNFLRCMFFGGVIFSIFTIIYFIQQNVLIATEVPWSKGLLKSMIQSLDITFLAGYTKYSIANDPPGQQFLLLINMILGLFWYGVSLPTLINKISVARL